VPARRLCSSGMSMNATASTPGTRAMAAAIRALWRVRAGASRRPGGALRTAITRSASMPLSCAVSARYPRSMIVPAQSSTVASATSTSRSAWRPRRAPVPCRPPPARSARGASADDRRAGRTPATATVSAAMIAAKIRTRASMPGSPSSCSHCGIRRVSAPKVAALTIQPPAAPAAASRTASINSCRAIAARPAPSAVRTASSRRRSSPCASSSPRTLTHEIRNTIAAAAKTSHRTVRDPRVS